MTLQEAKELKKGDSLSHVTMKTRKGLPYLCKVNGNVKVWKTRPNAVRIPCKRGLFDTFQVGAGDTDHRCDQDISQWIKNKTN